jgi:hypothetical protein
VELTIQPTKFSRTKGNNLKKGYYPTFPKDVEMIEDVLSISFGWNGRSVEEKRLTIFDPCAGEARFLNNIACYARKKAAGLKGADVVTYAVELDGDRFVKIRGVDQKLQGSFFDTETTGKFDLVLLNPPYNKQNAELLYWIEKAAPMVSYRGAMVLIIPEYELNKNMKELLRGSFSFRYAYRSEEHDAFKQVVIFLTRNQDNGDNEYRYNHIKYDNLDNSEDAPILVYSEEKASFKTATSRFGMGKSPLSLSISISGGTNVIKPLLQHKDLTELYNACEIRLEKAITTIVDRQYPSNYDTSIQPLSTLRTAHAVQLAAMNSQIESVIINGSHCLAKYMIVEKPETFEDFSDGIKTETTVYKPTVETFIMDLSGEVKAARDMGFDYVDLNTQLSTILLRKLTKMYKPLHEIGQDEEFLAVELEQIGLMAPQREAVRAVVKAFNSGRKGVGIRANTGTGKTWMAKAIKYIHGAKRSVMVTEPHLVPQLAKEYASENFDIHVIDSWEKAVELSKTRPKGLYLIAYTRLRMHPDFVPVTRTKRVKTPNGISYALCCPQCNSALGHDVRRSEKMHCTICGSPLFTYIPENKRPVMSFKRWIRDIEENGTSIEVKSHNKQLPYIRLLKKMSFDLAIFDEAHNAANLMSNQGTAFIRLAASASRVLALTATVTNGMAKSLYNILWGLNPKQMRDGGWSTKSATDFQAKFGAFKKVRKTDEKNRHREGERVTTYDTAGISPAALIYTLTNFINVDSEDFDNLPPVEREVIKCRSHAEVEDCIRKIRNIISDAKLPKEDRLPAASIETAAILRVSDTFKHANDELRLRGGLLGTLMKLQVDELLHKEEELVVIVNQVKERGERVLVYTGNTQKIDMRGPLRCIIAKNCPGVTIGTLPDSVPANKIVQWFENTTADVVITSFHRVTTGLNLSQFNNLVWYDYTDNTRMAEQGDGRIRRVNTADIHRALFGEVRPCRYWYLTSSPVQEAQLAYTLEKRMIAKLAEGETPDIDPAECSSGNQSFAALIARALQEGNIEYMDPSALLKKMTKTENAKVRAGNFGLPSAPEVEPVVVHPIGHADPVPNLAVAPVENAPAQLTAYAVIYRVENAEVEKYIPEDAYMEFLQSGALDITLFGTYYIDKQIGGRRKAA